MPKLRPADVQFINSYLKDSVDPFEEAHHDTELGEQYSNDIFRPSSAQDVRRFDSLDWEPLARKFASAKGFDPEGFEMFIASALDAELQRIEFEGEDEEGDDVGLDPSSPDFDWSGRPKFEVLVQTKDTSKVGLTGPAAKRAQELLKSRDQANDDYMNDPKAKAKWNADAYAAYKGKMDAIDAELKSLLGEGKTMKTTIKDLKQVIKEAVGAGIVTDPAKLAAFIDRQYLDMRRSGEGIDINDISNIISNHLSNPNVKPKGDLGVRGITGVRGYDAERKAWMTWRRALRPVIVGILKAHPDLEAAGKGFKKKGTNPKRPQVKDAAFWKHAYEYQNAVHWDEARQHMPAAVAEGFEREVIEDGGYDPSEFEFSYGPISYGKDDYEEDDEEFDSHGADDASLSDFDDASYYQAYNPDIDELWHCNAAGEWMLYNY